MKVVIPALDSVKLSLLMVKSAANLVSEDPTLPFQPDLIPDGTIEPSESRIFGLALPSGSRLGTIELTSGKHCGNAEIPENSRSD
jgi:hypothetical protein